MRVLHHTLGLLCLLQAGSLAAQQEPARFPPPSENRGEMVGLILGRTTLTDVQKIFSDRGQREALASARVPRRLRPAPSWTLGGAVIRPSIKVDETKESPTLYFDTEQRLVLVVDPAAKGQMSRTEFERQHPRARVAGRYNGTVALEAPLDTCVTVSGLFEDKRGQLQQLAYGYTCAAHSAEKR
jgi:hypothetical protein